jgi:hypothetical protein
VFWEASSFGLHTLRYQVPDDQKFLEVLLLVRNKGKEAFTVYQDKLVLRRDGEVTKCWEAVPLGHRIDTVRDQASFDKETSSYTVYHLESKGGECTLKPGEQTFLMMLFLVPSQWTEGSLTVTTNHDLKIQVPAQKHTNKQAEKDK